MGPSSSRLGGPSARNDGMEFLRWLRREIDAGRLAPDQVIMHSTLFDGQDLPSKLFGERIEVVAFGGSLGGLPDFLAGFRVAIRVAAKHARPPGLHPAYTPNMGTGGIGRSPEDCLNEDVRVDLDR